MPCHFRSKAPQPPFGQTTILVFLLLTALLLLLRTFWLILLELLFSLLLLLVPPLVCKYFGKPDVLCCTGSALCQPYEDTKNQKIEKIAMMPWHVFPYLWKHSELSESSWRISFRVDWYFKPGPNWTLSLCTLTSLVTLPQCNTVYWTVHCKPLTMCNLQCVIRITSLWCLLCLWATCSAVQLSPVQISAQQ